MTTDTHVDTISGTLTSDPARWEEPIIAGGIGSRMAAEREIAATASAVLGKSARIVLHHNTSGQWAVDIERAQGTRVYHLHWSSVTTNESGSFLVPITRGQAVTVLLHELFHVLYTDWVERPDWCHPRHWQEFFSVVNMSEDVRIEDAGENEVPVFAALRKRENERLLLGNVAGYPAMDSIRHVGLALYAARCIQSLAPRFVSMLNEAERNAFDSCLADFHWACDQRSTQALVNELEPVYEALLPFLPPVGSGGGDEQGGDDQGGRDEYCESDQEQGEGNEQEQGGGTSQGGGDDTDEQEQGGGGGSSGEEDEEDADPDEQEQGDGGEDGDPDEQPGDDESDGGGGDDTPGGNAGGTSPGGVTGGDGELQDIEEPMRPDRPRGEWDKPREDVGRANRDAIDYLMDGAFIRCESPPADMNAVAAVTAVTSRAIRSQLNRVLQHNADGSYAGRKRRGSFDANSARRLSLGDTRVFRTKQGPRGARDFSLVVLLDASSSVRGSCGNAIANAGYAVKHASEGVHGLDVAVAAYGGRGLIGAIPFGATDGQWRTFASIHEGVHGGHGGGTDETSGIVWARRASEMRGAEQPLIVVLTDGHPNDGRSVREQIDEARRGGTITGGIGISRRIGLSPVVPDYHEFYATARDLTAIPSVLADLLRTMMKAR